MVLLRPDIARADHLAPAGDLRLHEFPELRRRKVHRHAALVKDARALAVAVGEAAAFLAQRATMAAGVPAGASILRNIL
ncbi:hypothetical protein EJV46_07340 [Roseococcus sp. SYP-B2431]|uniref:hypothetical protein n=1 Tax=Roseococcus sp. SYP-B2431 TaxID=2496640 RepID=UPI00103FFB9B|nr:hypothetical protein [Roseococcus sp. SYP-B2431]TCI00438.1 hypothetical protein EJV46_07340 [Roseococcus sp. SYP-B2431]